MDLSVITATWARPEFLAHCLQQFQQQLPGGIACEHIVVSDGVDAHARLLCQKFKTHYTELDGPHADYGSHARDEGIQIARGRYVCFWDDDNLYHPHALLSLYTAAQHADIGIVNTQHRQRTRPGIVSLPRHWEGNFVNGDIDTMCVCVRRDLAVKETWVDDSTAINTDYRWLKRLMSHRPNVNFLPICIGMHV